LNGHRNQALGSIGEGIAAQWLVDHGFRVVARNVRTMYGELDIIAQQGRDVHVVEVKTRCGAGYGAPLEAIDVRKQQHLRRSTIAALETGVPGLVRPLGSVHIDAMSIMMENGSVTSVEFLADILA
jgi:putative endonuclease